MAKSKKMIYIYSFSNVCDLSARNGEEEKEEEETPGRRRASERTLQRHAGFDAEGAGAADENGEAGRRPIHLQAERGDCRGEEREEEGSQAASAGMAVIIV